MTSNISLRSTLKPADNKNGGGVIELSLITTPIPTPKDDEVVVKIEASPINPSDLGLLFSFADFKTVTTTKDEKTGFPIARVNVPPPSFARSQARVGQSLPVGNEGAGVVVSAGKNAQHLIGKKVGAFGGAMYSQYRVLHKLQVLELLPGTTSAEGAACFVNPLTVLGMIETMKSEGFKGLVHTAAASQLGQMLVKACKKDGIPLVNIVRKQDQVDILKSIGAQYVVNSSDKTFLKDLEDAIAATGAYLAFDATGGGNLASQILNAMEKAATRGSNYSIYGSDTLKKVYIYGGLDLSPTVIGRSFGMKWLIGGWLLMPFLQKIGPAATEELRQRVAREIKTTFASSYDREISLFEVLDSEIIKKYSLMATGSKFLINPTKNVPSKL